MEGIRTTADSAAEGRMIADVIGYKKGTMKKKDIVKKAVKSKVCRPDGKGGCAVHGKMDGKGGCKMK